MMNAQAMLDNFDLLAEAPGGVPKLRELILQLAVRGQLVPQEEGRAASLWTNTHLKTCITLVSGQHLTPLDYNTEGKGMPYLTGPADFGMVHPVPTRWTHTRRAVAKRGDILLTVKGAGVGKTNVVDRDEVAISRQLMALRPISWSEQYLGLFMRSVEGQLQERMTGIAIPGISREDVLALNIALPPLAEQKRIVARVDELMKRCDELEARQKERNDRHTALVSSCLHAVTEPKKPNSNFILHNSSFNLLFTSPESVAELRKTILQLAVQGRLVKQDEWEGSVEINGERTEMNIARTSGWRQVLFSDIATTAGGVTKGRTLKGKTACYPYLRVANVQRGYLDLTEVKDIEIAVTELERYALSPGDLLITEGGDWDKVGRMALWQGEIAPCLHQNHVFRAQLRSADCLRDWVLLYFNSAAREYFAQASKQTTNLASINMRQLRSCPVPLPPLAEQKRIVAKVNELMALCDALEAKLTQSRSDADTLAAAIVHAVGVDSQNGK